MKRKTLFGKIGLLMVGTLLLGGCQENEVNKTVQENKMESHSGIVSEDEQESSSGNIITDTKDSAIYGVVDLTPYVTLGEYKGVHVPEIKAQTVTDEEVRERMKQWMASSGGEREEKNGPIEKGDYVVVSFQGYLDDLRIEEAKFEDMTLQVGEYLMLPDFEDGLIGAKSGDIFTINVKIPEEYDDTYAGQVLEYDVKVSMVYTMKIPELTDANVKKFLDIDTVEAFEKEVRRNIQSEYDQTAKDQMNEAVMNQVFASATIKEYPSEYLEQFIQQIRQSYEKDAANKELTMSQYIEQMQLTEEQFEEQIVNIAKADMATEMVYQAIVQKENLTLTEEEVEEGAKDYVDGTTYLSVEEVLEKTDYERLKQRLLYKKAHEFVLLHAIIDN